jgi:hypothetical protein
MRTFRAIVVLTVLALAGCGPEGDLVQRRPAIPDQPVSEELGSSPALTAIAWWDALQAHDSEALLAPLTPAARETVSLDHLGRALHGDLGDWAEATDPNVLYTERRPGHATVYMRIDGGGLVGSRLVKGGALMLALPLESRGGVWLIDNAAWLRGRSDAYVAVQKLRARMKREVLRNAQKEQEDK